MADQLQNDENSLYKKHITVLYHHMSYQNSEPNLNIQAKHEGTSERDFEKPKVEDYLPFAILSVVIFMPLGALSLMYSLRVQRAVKRDDTESAVYFSNWAIQHALTAYITGSILTMLIFTVLYICVYTV